jgi:2-keto-3-deoxy-L-rhamnonate aldolase RhmA
MKVNTAKRMLRAEKTVVGTMITEARSPEIPRALAASGLDFIVIDTEHSAFDFSTVSDMIRAGRNAGLSCYVRVTGIEDFLIARALDIGAHGIMVPLVETRDQVERTVAAAKYPPKGRRGYGLRSIVTDFETASMKEWMERLNEDTMVIIQIESKEAIDNIDQLISVEGVDAAIIGPNDLSISLGVPGQLDHELMVEYIRKVVDACKRHGVAAGTHLRNLDMLRYWRDRGMQLLMYSTDVELLMDATRSAVKQLRG